MPAKSMIRMNLYGTLMAHMHARNKQDVPAEAARSGMYVAVYVVHRLVRRGEGGGKRCIFAMDGRMAHPFPPPCEPPLRV